MAKLEPGAIPTRILHCLADGSCQTIEELETALGFNRRQVSDGASRLLTRKYLLRMGRGCYQLSDAGLVAAAAGEIIVPGPLGPNTVRVRKQPKDTFRDRAWRAMRVRRQFTLSDIVSDAADGDNNPTHNLRCYLRYLKAAGYVVELVSRQSGTRLTSNGFKRFRLVKNTGPHAPVYRPTKQAVHDFNTGEDVPCR